MPGFSEQHIFRVNQEDELPSVAREIARLLPEAGVVLFDGVMGAGKTTLIRELCKVLGVVDEVSSPTYSIVNEYLTKSGSRLYHFDLYRINNPEELLDIGIEEYLAQRALCLIEWPDRLGYLEPDNALRVCVEDCGQYRQISL